MMTITPTEYKINALIIFQEAGSEEGHETDSNGSGTQKDLNLHLVRSHIVYTHRLSDDNFDLFRITIR